MKIAIYSRKSVYTGKGDSIENQIEMCRQYIAANLTGVTAVDVFEDEGFSAKNTQRPQFLQMLAEIRQKKYDCVVCYRLDRISRNVGDFAALIDELNCQGIAFICIREKFDTSTPMGKAMMFIASVFAQLERETLAERVRDNMFMLARSGRWLGGTPPTGFVSEKTERIDVDGKIRTACMLTPDPAGIETVKAIYADFLATGSVSAVCARFSRTGVRQILENPVYCAADRPARDFFVSQGSDVCFAEGECSRERGLLSYNKRDCKKKHAPRHARSEWIIAIGRHAGVVPGAQWVAAQRLLAAKAPAKPRQRNEYSLLSGLIYCTKCGGRMFSRRRGANAAGGQFDYICGRKLQGGVKACGCKNLNGQLTDELIFGYILRRADEVLAARALPEKPSARQRIKPGDGFRPEAVASALDTLAACADTLTLGQKRELIRLLAQKIEWDGQDAHIFLRGLPQ